MMCRSAGTRVRMLCTLSSWWRVDTNTATAPESQRLYSTCLGGQRGIDRNVGAAGGEAGVVGDGPLGAILRQDGDPVAWADAQLVQAEAQVLYPVGQIGVAQVEPLAVALGAGGHRPGAEPRQRPEVELVEGSRRGRRHATGR